MARVNIYLPDDVARRAREAGLNVSALTRTAVEAQLNRSAMSQWLASVNDLPETAISHTEALRALDDAREELWGELPREPAERG